MAIHSGPDSPGTAVPGPEQLEPVDRTKTVPVNFELHGRGKRKVALADPPLLEVLSGQSVEFTHNAAGEVTLMFPRVFFEEGQYFLLEEGRSSITLKVRNDLPLGDRKRKIPYQVYFSEGNVFAIGESPPKMIVDPPPPPRLRTP